MSTSVYKGKKLADDQKLRGGYYTPIKLADYLVEWALRSGTERILEPSAGDGNFIVSSLKHCRNSNIEILAVEINEEEIKKGKRRINTENVNWITGDFFALYSQLKNEEKFDVVVGNPPFIRFQYFDDDSREIAFNHLRKAGYKPTKLANAWTAFVQLSIELLKEGGRLAMVVPAELLQVKYAAELRSRLTKKFEHIVLIGFKKLVFPEIQQEVFLLLAEGKKNSVHTSDIHTIEYENGDDLISHGSLSDAIAHVPSKHTRNGMKWTSLFLSNRAFSALDEAEQALRLTPFGELAQVDVGIVTGRNSFFVLSAVKRKQLKAENYTVPLVGRTSALNSIAFTESEFEKYIESNPAFLLDLNGFSEEDLPKTILDYIKDGERENVHKGYKCRIRRRWFDVPSIYIPDAFLFRQIHKYPLLVINEARVTSTDTIHRVRVRSDVNPRLLAAVAFNSLTLAWAEVCGRSYGGGVLELEPREAEELPIPYDNTIKISAAKVDKLLRTGNDTAALDYVDNIVLKNYLCLKENMIENIRRAWKELRNRRINRR